MARSKTYPSYTISYCVEFAKKIYQQYGNSTFLDRKTLAKIEGISEPSVQLRASSAVQYGLLEMKSGEGYKPSGLFLKIHKPLNDKEKREALLTAFKRPKLYSQLITEFEGKKLPPHSGLATVLFRKYNIIENASEKSAKVFYENSKFLNLLDAEGMLNLEDKTLFDEIEEKDTVASTNKHEEEIVETDSKSILKTNKNLDIESRTELSPNERKIDILLTGRKKGTLTIPDTLNSKDLDLIKKQIEVLELYVDYSNE